MHTSACPDDRSSTRPGIPARSGTPFLARTLKTLVAGLAAAASLVLVPPAASARTMAQPTLPMVTLQAGIQLIRAEVADDDRKRATGLMFRESLAPNHGMLFVFARKAGHCFWMRNTLIPLSIAFIDDDGTIVNIADMAPHSEASHCPARPVRFALEMTQGWFAQRGIAAGYRLTGKEVFGPGTETSGPGN